MGAVPEMNSGLVSDLDRDRKITEDLRTLNRTGFAGGSNS